MNLVEFFRHGNQQATSCPSLQCLVVQIQVQKPILVVATDEMPDHIWSRDTTLLISIDSIVRDTIIRKVINES